MTRRETTVDDRAPRPAPGREDDHSLARLRVRPGTTYVSSGRTVLSTDEDGVVLPRLDHGLFVHETRLLSRWRWLIEDAPPQLVSASNVAQRSWLGYYIVAAPGGAPETARDPISGAAQAALELRISRYVGGGMHEDIDLTNFARWSTKARLTLEIESDFADLTETGGERRQAGRSSQVWRARDGGWELTASHAAERRWSHQGRRGTARISRGVTVRFSNADSRPRRRGRRITFDVALAPHETWHCCIDVTPRIEDLELPPAYGCRSFTAPASELERRTQVFLQEATCFSTPESGTLCPVVAGALEQGKRDLASLRLFDLDTDEHAWTVAAGLPLYVALFGRDTLTAAWEAAPVSLSLMRGTLPVLARWQGRAFDDWRDEEPGRMLHEAHTGPLASLNLTPQGRSYGSLTTSGFYPFVLAQLWHWSADKALVQPYVDTAVAALKWMTERSDRNRDGFFDYQTRSSMGVENQGWKDSGDALVQPSPWSLTASFGERAKDVLAGLAH